MGNSKIWSLKGGEERGEKRREEEKEGRNAGVHSSRSVPRVALLTWRALHEGYEPEKTLAQISYVGAESRCVAMSARSRISYK